MDYILKDEIKDYEPDIDLSSKMTSTQFMAFYHYKPQAALELLTGMIQEFIEYEVEKFHQRPYPEVTSDYGNNITTKRKSNDLAGQKKHFKKYLKEKQGFEDAHPYLWDDLKEFGTGYSQNLQMLKFQKNYLRRLKNSSLKSASSRPSKDSRKKILTSSVSLRSLLATNKLNSPNP
eukprot:Mrub_06484.p1 GENE.Mrub_06484~~Mrub_06484.p1  ORF type:complete len:176 (-),score=21.56 Mrub_06484:480-1007(-)